MATTETLKINNWSIPISEIELSRKELGAYERTQDGRYLKSSRNVQRTLTATTTPLLRRDAEMLCGIIEGQGDYIDFSGSYTRKGSYFTDTTSGLTTIPIPSYASSPQYRQLHSQSFTPYFSAYAAGLKNAPNLFTSLNVVTGTDTLNNTTGFTSVNSGVLTSSLSYALQGSKSLKLVCPSDSNSLRAGGYTTFPVAESGLHTCSVYVFSQNATQIRLAIADNGTGTEVSSGVKAVSPLGIWTRVFLTASLTSGTTYRFVFSETADNTGAEYYFDGFKAEKYDIPTAVNFSGGTSDLYLSGDLSKFAEISSSFSCIMQLSCVDPTALEATTITTDQKIIEIFGPSSTELRARTDIVRMYYDTSDDKMKLRVESDVTNTTLILEATSRPSNTGSWFGFGLRNYAQHDEHAIKLWGGGPLIRASSDTLVDMRLNRSDALQTAYFSSSPKFAVGGAGNTSAPLYAATLFIFPYDISTSYFSSFVDSVQPVGAYRPIVAFPDFYVDSSLLPRAQICNGIIKDISTAKGWVGGTFYNNLQRVSFELCETYGRFGAVA